MSFKRNPARGRRAGTAVTFADGRRLFMGGSVPGAEDPKVAKETK